ncbi:hypothetical protein KS461_06050 [Pseudomonas chlororaphis]|uniref:phage tail fiber protein n=1 Tax=Pseudomonas chlororaphis TaxID=587753 RepID=UPI00215AB64A|nr:hypothetical protein [Pseudomonas chlororaphis]UVE46845.1 hypothetical protein KS461_06050 [Pseudomonas chlororaphis]
MSKQAINLGVIPTGVGGDTPRSANIKINGNFDEVYAALGATGSPATLPAALPVSLGGTGTTTAANALFPTKVASGLGTIVAPDAGGYDNPASDQGGGLYKIGPGPSSSGLSYASMIRVPYAANYEAQIYFPMGLTTNKMYFRCALGPAGGTFGAAVEVYHTGNTTRGSGGVLSAASPIVRIANVVDSDRGDLLEQTFEAAGAWGVANEEARGVSVERLGVGEYRVTGSLGLALEGWRTQDPCSPDGGGTLGITESQQAKDGAITIKLFKQRWTLSEDGEMIPGRGAPLDVPLNSWIDVRLEMPPVEPPPQQLAEIE